MDDATLDTTLKDRAARYGSFAAYACCAQRLKAVVDESAPHALPYIAQEAIAQILGKLARIIMGDPFYLDSWDDIAGYALCARRALADLSVKNAGQNREPIFEKSCGVGEMCTCEVCAARR